VEDNIGELDQKKTQRFETRIEMRLKVGERGRGIAAGAAMTGGRPGEGGQKRRAGESAS
jgi:hypothetical protein